jgi:hypothetical protein
VGVVDVAANLRLPQVDDVAQGVLADPGTIADQFQQFTEITSVESLLDDAEVQKPGGRTSALSADMIHLTSRLGVTTLSM